MEQAVVSRSRGRGSWAGAVGTAAFFGVLYVYVWRFVEPHLIYHSLGAYQRYLPFEPGALFFHTMLRIPAGMVEYAAGFLTQWFYYPWLGALIIVAVAAGFFAAVRGLLVRFGARWAADLAYLFALMVVMMYGQYDHALRLQLALLAGLGLAWVWTALPLRNGAAAAGTFLVLGFLNYAVAGASVLAFGAIAAAYALLRLRRPTVAGAIAVLSVGIAAAMGAGLYAMEWADAFTLGLPIGYEEQRNFTPWTRWLLAGLTIGATVLPVVLGAWEVWSQRRRKSARSTAGKSPAAEKRRATWATSPTVLSVLQLLVLAGVTFGAIWTARSVEKPVLEMHYFARIGEWQKVLEAAQRQRRLGLHHPAANFDTNRALHHLGRLGDEMFAYPQALKALLFNNVDGVRSSLTFQKQIDISMDLGDFNPAEHWGYELLEAEGGFGANLLDLAKVHAVKGQCEAAQVLLHALEKNPAYREAAQRWLARMEDAESLGEEPWVASRRAMLRDAGSNHEVREMNVEQYLGEILDENPANRTAFEYLMAYYLLTHKQEQVAANLGRMRELGYSRLPRHWAEAVLIYISKTRRQPDMHGYTIDPEIVREFQQVTGTMRRMNYDRGAAARALAAEYGDSYLFYSLFNVSGVKP